MDGAGIYEDMKRDFGVTAPAGMGSIDAEELGDAVIRAVERDLPDVLLMRNAPRLAVTLHSLAPRLVERVTRLLNLNALFRDIARQRLAADER
jgi:hypothetical protein